MSYLQRITTRIRDPAALRAACQRLGLSEPTTGSLMVGNESVTGWIVRLPQWHDPMVIDLATGQITYRIDENADGDIQSLSRLLQGYACEKAKIEAGNRGHSISERLLPDGSIMISIQVRGVS